MRICRRLSEIERIDAETFADWGIEYFKYDYCHHKLISSLAPNIDKIIISGDKLTEDIVLEAENGELYGTAKGYNRCKRLIYFAS